jgi:hypothetical protein
VVVDHAEALLNRSAAPTLHEPVEIAADHGDLRLAVGQAFRDEEVRPRGDDLAFDAVHAHARDEVAELPRLGDGRFADCRDPVAHHADPAAFDQAERQACAVVLGRDHLVRAVVGEEPAPGVQVHLVQAGRIVVVQVAQLGAQLAHGFAALPLTSASAHASMYFTSEVMSFSPPPRALA